MQNAKVAIIGGGFSGLSLAWRLLKLQIPVVIYEAQNEVGGMLKTKRSPVLSESAANAILSSVYVEELLKELNINFVIAGHKSNHRWILSRGYLSRWPLSWVETITSAYQFTKNILLNRHRPLQNETVRDWCRRVFKNSLIDTYLLGPALQGVYAVGTEQLSAELIIGPMFQKSDKRIRYRQSISPLDGMQSIVEKLKTWILSNGGEIKNSNSLEDIQEISETYSAVIIATSLKNASSLLQKSAPNFSQKLAILPSQGLTNVGLGFSNERTLKGFGCLFAPSENLSSLGVLFNSDIFKNRGPLENETWITRNTTDSDSNMISHILSDRKKVFKLDQAPTFIQIHKWPNAIPVYGLELLNFLKKQSDQSNASEIFNKGLRVQEIKNKAVYLTGNYLGGIGLAKILTYNVGLAERIKKELA